MTGSEVLRTVGDAASAYKEARRVLMEHVRAEVPGLVWSSVSADAGSAPSALSMDSVSGDQWWWDVKVVPDWHLFRARIVWASTVDGVQCAEAAGTSVGGALRLAIADAHDFDPNVPRGVDGLLLPMGGE